MDGPDPHAVDLVRREAQPLAGLHDLDLLIDQIGRSRLVLLGEATHGTHEFYAFRAALTLRLVRDRGFDAVAVEADWPAAWRASRWVRGSHADAGADAALAGFERFPRWMWRNAEVVSFLEDLRHYNEGMVPSRRVGFHGIDLYSLRESMHAVLHYLDTVDPAAAQRARARYACFDDLAHEPQAYGHAVSFGLRGDCEREVVAQLAELLRAQGSRLDAEGRTAHDDEQLFYAQQNARVVRNAETYYRAMFSSRHESWNVRDQHMAQTLRELDHHLSERRGRPARMVVWAHNSHLGDARATDVSRQGQLNLGQLVREDWPEDESFILGFTTHTGTVAAAHDWDMDVEHKRVKPSRADSIEGLMHATGHEHCLVPIRHGSAQLRAVLAQPLLERAIGVIYRPDTERLSHYFEASVSRQFDALVHWDVTRAVRPLDVEHPWEHAEETETYPSGL